MSTRVCRGHAGVLPIMFFALGFVVATIGAGATPASALLAPPAMAMAARAGVPPLLMAIMAGNGALAGTLSPFAPTGIVAHGVMQRINLGGVEWQTFAYNALAHTLVGFGGFLLLGGWRLFLRRDGTVRAEDEQPGEMDTRHWLTAAGIVVLIVYGRRPRDERRNDGAHHRDSAHSAARRERGAGDPAYAVGRHSDGDRRDGADLDDAGDAGARVDRERHRARVDAADG